MIKCGKPGKLKASFPHFPDFFENFPVIQFESFHHLLEKPGSIK